MKKLKVFHVVRQFTPSIGGLEDVVYNIAKQQLLNSNQEPTVITLDRLFKNNTQRLPAEEIIDGIKVIRLPYSGSSRYPICFGVLNAIKPADVVHVHGVDFFYDFLAITKFIHGKNLVASSHGIFFHTDFASTSKQIFFNTVTRISSLFYKKIFATSDNDASLFKKITSSERVETIENGVDIDKFHLHSRSIISKKIIYFGRWSVNKGLIQTIDLFNQLWLIDSEWELCIAGREYDLTENILNEKIATLQCANNVKLCPNPSVTELRDLVHQNSYFICLSRHEGFGLAAIEAMSGALTPLLSDIPPFSKLVKSTGFGLVLSKSNELNISTISKLHQELLGQELDYSQRLVNSTASYSWDFVAKRYIDFYAYI